MWQLVLRKMMNNKWMMLCLLGGFVIVVAMVSSVPIYTDGILQFMLNRDMRNYQNDTRKYPGCFQIKLAVGYTESSRTDLLNYFSEKLENEYLLKTAQIPNVAENLSLSAENMQATAVEEAQRSKDRTFINVTAISALPEHVKILSGRLYEPGIREDGCYEAVISQTALSATGLQMNVPYSIAMMTQKETTLKFIIVGVVEQSDYADPYWNKSLAELSKNILIDQDTFREIYLSDGMGAALSNATWFQAFDYNQIQVDGLNDFLQAIYEQQDFCTTYKSYVKLSFPILSTLEDYAARAAQLQNTLLVILVPLFVMLALYIFMISGLIIRSDETEIALLRSRGASSGQIFLIYLLEGFLIGLLTLGLGPLLGYALCRIVGASNGFLEFVQRTALPLKLTRNAYLYSAIAVGVFMVTMLIPAYTASRTTIVERKRQKSRFLRQPFWKKFFLDFLSLGVAIYGYTQYERFNSLIVQSGTSSTDLNVDPLLFLISSLFILGAGLLFLRIYPYLIQFIFWAGRKHWSPSLYASLVQVGRSSGQEQFLMLFIILSIAVGIFNANSARTLNQNVEDKIYYQSGADVIITPEWQSNAEEIAERAETDPLASQVVTYLEPSFTPYEELDGVEHAAKVFCTDDGVIHATVSSANMQKKVRIMGIEPAEFGKTAWFRNDLLPYHWYNYLNLIVDAPKACLLSANLAETLGVEVGDPIYVSWGAQAGVECTVYALIDFWPTYDPDENSGCVICNLSFLQSTLAKEPYQVWLKKADTATDAQIQNALDESSIRYKTVSYSKQSLIEVKNDPLLQGLNGMLTLSFIITMLVTAIGFLIYWALSIRSRALQFGIFRAMGMSLWKVWGILLSEQVLISVVSIAVGIALGGAASELFVPMMQMVYAGAQQVPAFRVIMLRSDYYKIYGVVGGILLVGYGILSRIVASIKIDQALKLGED